VKLVCLLVPKRPSGDSAPLQLILQFAFRELRIQDIHQHRQLASTISSFLSLPLRSPPRNGPPPLIPPLPPPHSPPPNPPHPPRYNIRNLDANLPPTCRFLALYTPHQHDAINACGGSKRWQRQGQRRTQDGPPSNPNPLPPPTPQDASPTALFPHARSSALDDSQSMDAISTEEGRCRRARTATVRTPSPSVCL
jgi:hypothetical protein